MIIYGLIAYLGFILMVIGYFFVKKSGDKDTKVYSSLEGEFIIPDSDYWTLDGFLKLI